MCVIRKLHIYYINIPCRLILFMVDIFLGGKKMCYIIYLVVLVFNAQNKGES